MIFVKYLLHWGGIAMMVAAAAILARDLYLYFQAMRKKETAEPETTVPEPPPVRWRVPAALVALGCMPLILASGIVVVPSGTAGVRISQTSGTIPGTLYPGAHFLVPLAESVVLFDTRD